jgi:hypothetical protein
MARLRVAPPALQCFEWGTSNVTLVDAQTLMNEREQYMLNALQVIASYGREQPKPVLREYMREHQIKWDNDEDVKVWMRRIAEDAIRYVASINQRGSTAS